jgi:hypothetical protein
VVEVDLVEEVALEVVLGVSEAVDSEVEGLYFEEAEDQVEYHLDEQVQRE